MNNKTKKIIMTCLMICLIFTISFMTIKVGADSGFDTSFDSGGSSDWGSDSSGSGGSTDPVAIAIWAIFFFPLFTFAIIMLIKNEKKFKDSIKKMNSDDVLKIDSNLNINEFEEMVYSKFVAIQEDWMNFNYDGLRNNLSDELYNQYEMQLDSLKVKNEKNVMVNFKLLKCYIKDIKMENGIETIDTILIVKFNDYIVNDNDEVIRGDKNTIYKMTYKLTFGRNVDGKVSKCPKCGAEINKNINKCPYCRAVLNKTSNEWVMSKKELLRQLSYSTGSKSETLLIRIIVIFMIGTFLMIGLFFLLLLLKR